jgi:hypothetical protein
VVLSAVKIIRIVTTKEKKIVEVVAEEDFKSQPATSKLRRPPGYWLEMH